MRIPGLNPASAPKELAAMFEAQTKRFGSPLPSSLIMARRPMILAAQGELAKGIDASGLLPTGLPPLVMRRVAALNGCPF